MARLGTLRVSDVLDYERDIKGKRLIRLRAGVGAGKNYWARHLLEKHPDLQNLLITSRKIQQKPKPFNWARIAKFIPVSIFVQLCWICTIDAIYATIFKVGETALFSLLLLGRLICNPPLGTAIGWEARITFLYFPHRKSQS